MHFKLFQGDCIEVMRSLPDASVDSIVTDPPYGISFMGRHWDYDVPGVDVWREAYRVLKPGGHLLSFGGTRTHHRIAVNIEDAGFEIRDMLAWVYGSGFPKSMDVSKAIDKAAGAEREVIGNRAWSNARMDAGNGISGLRQSGSFAGNYEDERVQVPITAPATDDAKQWQGWGTALKPALEPIVLARKPLSEKTVAANVLKHATGAMNIDACRVPLQGDCDAAAFENNHRVTERLPSEYDGQNLGLHDGGWKQRVGEAVIPNGRWPANLIHDGSDEVLSAFPDAKGQQGSTAVRTQGGVYGKVTAGVVGVAPRIEVSDSSARFFYHAKASKRDRGEGNTHPTVKPVALMRYLLRLVTPPGGVTLDNHCGSGSTGVAAMLEGFDFIGIDLDRDKDGTPLGYLDIARRRISAAQAEAFDSSGEL